MAPTSTVFEGVRGNPRRLLVFLRTAIVVGAAAFLLYRQVGTGISVRSAQRTDSVRHFRADPIHASEVLWSAPIFIGLIAEFLSYRLARVVNTAYYALGAAYLAAGFAFSYFNVLGFNEPEHWILILILLAVPYAGLATVLFLLYRSTSPAHLVASDAA
jgi:hypothetical protein